MSALEARLTVRRGNFTLDLPLRAGAGEVVALLGPNGAGKTTALRALAGLLPLEEGHIHLDGEPVHLLPPERRPVGVVFQDHLLFPHLSALENVAFGPRCRGMPRRAAREHAAAWLERVGLGDHLAAKPRALSGGQAQRVALARALAVEPRLLLLDEPMAALDVRTRPEIRALLRRHLADFPGVTVLVTHDPLEAMALADRLVVVEEGHPVQEGAPAEIARRPRTGYIARLVGLNLHRGRADGRTVVLDASRGAEPLRLHLAEPAQGEVFVAFPPSAVRVHRAPPQGAGNRWPARVEAVEWQGDRVRVELEGPVQVAADIPPEAVAEAALTEGEEVWATLPAGALHVYCA